MLPSTALYIKLSSWKVPSRFFSVSLARAYVHVSDGSREGPAGESIC